MPYCTGRCFYLKYCANSVKYGVSGDFALDESCGTINRILFPASKASCPRRPALMGRMSYRFPEKKLSTGIMNRSGRYLS